MLTTGCTALNEREYAKIVESFQGRFRLRDRALFVVGARTGFRIAELLSLKIEDIWNFETNEPLEAVRVAREKMKGKRKARSMPLHREACEAVTDWIRSARLNHHFYRKTYLFPRQGDNSSAMTRQCADLAFRKAFRMAKVPPQGTHAMRKTFASRLWVSPFIDRDITKMRELLGHESILNTARYIQHLDNTLETAVLA